ncbi:MAG: hypothetical protein MUP16_07700 [Sedimentisphaerales bacterium]|nr:hypothetical protein [Sedimentisphaerales bacterium]
MSSQAQNIPVLDKQLLEPLGKITANFSFLEDVLSSCIVKLLFGNDSEEQIKGRIITAELSFRQKINLFCSLYKRLPQKDNNVIEQLRKELSDVEEKRNRITHSFLISVSDGTKAQDMRIKYSAKGKKGFTIDYEEISPDNLNKIAGEIAQITGKLELLSRNEIASSLPATARRFAETSRSSQ